MAARNAVVSSVNSSATSVALFAVVTDGSVVARSVVNNSAEILFLKYGTSASSSSYTAKLAAGDIYEFPEPLYDGVVHGIWQSANGAAITTEVTV